MIPDNEIEIYWDLMHSLDQAFLAHQGMASQEPQTWGEMFFEILAREQNPEAPPVREIYMVATGLMLRLMYSRPGPEMAFMIRRRPESFLRSVLMFMEMKNGCPNVNCNPASQA